MGGSEVVNFDNSPIICEPDDIDMPIINNDDLEIVSLSSYHSIDDGDDDNDFYNNNNNNNDNTKNNKNNNSNCNNNNNNKNSNNNNNKNNNSNNNSYYNNNNKNSNNNNNNLLYIKETKHNSQYSPSPSSSSSSSSSMREGETKRSFSSSVRGRKSRPIVGRSYTCHTLTNTLTNNLCLSSKNLRRASLETASSEGRLG